MSPEQVVEDLTYRRYAEVRAMGFKMETLAQFFDVDTYEPIYRLAQRMGEEA